MYFHRYRQGKNVEISRRNWTYFTHACYTEIKQNCWRIAGIS